MEHKDWKAETVQMWGDKRPSVSLGSDIVYSDTGYLQLESRSHLSRAMWHVERRLNISWSCIPSPETASITLFAAMDQFTLIRVITF